MLVLMLVIGSIIGVQIGQKLGERIDSSGLRALLAILLLIVGIAIAYDSFFAEDIISISNSNNGVKSLSPLAKFVKQLSIDQPFIYGMFSIVLALGLGIGAAIVRRQLSNIRKKYIEKMKSQAK